MHRIMIPVTALVLFGGVHAVSASHGETAANDPQTAAAAAVADGKSEASTPAAAAPAANGEAWRYRRHQDLWWYWLPTEKWVYWTGSEWKAYDAESYAQFKASRANRSYSYSRGSDWGRWGPVRYNGYGQPEYPYSRRTRGIKQLGPVPAMGGVRSLPGWGGER
jgi:hypothetical protein